MDRHVEYSYKLNAEPLRFTKRFYLSNIYFKLNIYLINEAN